MSLITEHNGTCGRQHGVLEEKVNNNINDIKDIREKQKNQNIDISERVRWNVLLPIVAIIVTITIAGFGFFINTVSSNIKKISDDLGQMETRYESVNNKLFSISVAIERLRVVMEQYEKTGKTK